MLSSRAGSGLKRLFDSNDLAWMLPLPPWADRRDRQVRKIRTAARGVLRRRIVAERGWFSLLTSSLVWPLLAVVKAIRAPRLPGKISLRNLLDRWWLQVAHNLRIEEQDGFRLDLPAQRKRVRRFVTDGENRAFMEFLNRHAQPERVRDKIPFARFCAAHGLPSVPILAERETPNAPARWITSAPLPKEDLFLKPAGLWGGQGACLLTFDQADGTWRADDGTVLTRETLPAYADRRLPDLAWVLQPRLRNGPAWAALSPGALCTVRVITGRATTETPPEVIAGFMRFPRARAVVDNLGAGGIGADFDRATGRLGSARGLDFESPRFDRHPDTGAAIAGVMIPEWTAVTELALRAHALLPELALIGWDVALPGAEPVLIEANTNWGVALDTPLGETRYVEILTERGW